MAWHVYKNRQKIYELIQYLIKREEEIEVRVRGNGNRFSSKIIKLDEDNSHPDTGMERQLIIEKLAPENGNSLIQSAPQVIIGFTIRENVCQYFAEYLGISNVNPYFGFVVSFPEAIQIREKRREERYTYKRPNLVSVSFRVNRFYQLSVQNSSPHGLGFLVTEKDFDLLEAINVGDKLNDMMFNATSALIRVNGIVRHKTRIDDGRYKGCYLVGIESPDMIENYKPNGS